MLIYNAFFDRDAGFTKCKKTCTDLSDAYEFLKYIINCIFVYPLLLLKKKG